MKINTLRFNRLIVISFCFLFSFFTSTLQAQSVLESDSLALVALYNSTNGDHWTRNDNWLEGPVSSWYGIETRDNRVYSIKFNSNNLSGSIPPEIGNLSAIYLLHIIDESELTGNIPSTIGNLISLEDLIISGNKINGNIPPELGKLTQLRKLYFNSTEISGPIPPEIGNLSNINTLSLYENKLTGNIPSTIGNLKLLNSLGLGYNKLNGHLPSELFNIPDLRVLHLNGNELYGTFPQTVASAKSLITLNVSNYKFEGSFPQVLLSLFDIEELYLGQNNFSGPIPKEIKNLKRLRRLELNNNKFSGSIPSEIGTLINLYSIDLSVNQLTGEVPKEFVNLINLMNLSIGWNYLEKLPDLSGIPYLGHAYYGLYVHSNKFTFEDIIPNLSIPNFQYSYQKKFGEEQRIQKYEGEDHTFTIEIDPNLNDSKYVWYKNNKPIDTVNTRTFTIDNLSFEDQGVYYCQVTNERVANLTLLSSPFYLSVRLPDGKTYLERDSLVLVEIFHSTGGENWNDKQHWLTGPLSSWTRVKIRDGRVKDLSLTSNNLIGQIPDDIQYLTSLEYLNLSGNQLSGEIPSQIQHLRELRYLGLHYNNLSGNIPKEVGQLSYLETLDLQYNQLTDSLPNEIGLLQNLEILNLGKNKISGIIPTNIGNLKKLKWLVLNTNNLEGEIPEEIGDLLALQQLFLGENNLTGTLPVTLSQLKNLELLDLISNKLEGEVSEELANLPALSYLSIAGNAFTKVPDLTSISQFRINHNRLSFDDILPNVLDTSEYYHYWQFNLTEDIEISIEENTTYTIDLKIDEEIEDNEYTWYKDNVKITTSDSNKFTLENVSLRDAGSYYCVIRNPNLPKLTLVTGKFLVNVGDIKAVGSVIAADSLALVDLYKSTQGEKWGRNDNWLKTPVYNWYGVQIWNKRVTSIRLPANNLSGTLPPEIGALTGLSILDLKDNQINGIIPVEVGDLTWLHSLNLSNNKFSGSIPNSFGNFTRIKLIYLSNNQLDGQIPEELEKLKDLDVFSIDHNNFNSNTIIPQAILDSANINIVGNQYTFQNIIPALEAALKNSNDFFYNPQDTIGNEKIVTAENNRPFFLDLKIGSAIATNQYQWFKDGDAFAITNTNRLIFENITSSDAGVYSCAITNSHVPNLTLQIAPITLVIKNEQTITFTPIPDKTYGDTPFLPTATSDAGLEVSFEVVSGPAHLSGDTLTITGAGDVTVKAFNAGNDTYLPAETVRSFTVVKASQTLTFDTISDKTLDDVPFSLTASASSGLPVSFMVEGPASLDDDVLTLTDTGKVTITASQPGNENYLPAEAVIRSFMVKAATFTLSGKVKTGTGDPVGSGAVILYAPNEAGRLTTFQTGVLNNDGTYAFNGLEAGDYSVGVIPDDPAFLTTYLGDVVVRAEATLVTLTQNTENAPITLLAKTQASSGNITISGVLVLEENSSGGRILVGAGAVEGIPLPGVAVFLMDASGHVIATEITDAAGKFSFENIPAGSYVFKADYEGMPHDADNFAIEVNNKDVAVTALVAKEGIVRLQEVSVVTGIADTITQPQVKLYPNPTEGKFSILLDAYWMGGSLSIHNMFGQTIVQIKIQNSNLSFDLAPEKAGVYAITLQKGESWQVMRVSKL